MTWNHTFESDHPERVPLWLQPERTFRLVGDLLHPRLCAEEASSSRHRHRSPWSIGVPAFGLGISAPWAPLAGHRGGTDENMQFTDNLHIIRGKHNVRTGFQISRQAYFQITNFSGNPSIHLRWAVYRTADRTGDGVVGVPPGCACQGGPRGAIGDGQQDMRSTYYGAYLQDDWRIFPNFSINIGLRYEFAHLPVEIHNRSLLLRSPNWGEGGAWRHNGVPSRHRRSGFQQLRSAVRLH